MKKILLIACMSMLPLFAQAATQVYGTLVKSADARPFSPQYELQQVIGCGLSRTYEIIVDYVGCGRGAIVGGFNAQLEKAVGKEVRLTGTIDPARDSDSRTVRGIPVEKLHVAIDYGDMYDSDKIEVLSPDASTVPQ